MKTKLLIHYKIGYDPNKKQKSIKEEIPPFKDLATSFRYTGLEKFHNFGQYCLGAFKAAWENELAQNFQTNALRTNPAFDRVLAGNWTRFYGHTDLRKAVLKMILKLK